MKRKLSAAAIFALAALLIWSGTALLRLRTERAEAAAHLAETEAALRSAVAESEALQERLTRSEAETAAAHDAALTQADAAADAQERIAALEAELASERQADSAPHKGALTEHTLATAHLRSFRYLLYTPGRPSGGPLPLLLFLHGSGGCGDDPDDLYSDDTLPTMLQRGWLSPNALVVIPQCPTDAWEPYCADLLELLDHVADAYGADRARISVTGFSMGGIACFSLLTRYPDYFSAAMPISALCDPASCTVITSTPLRILHGALDRVIDPASVILANDVINAAGGQSTLTFFLGEGHFIQQHYLDDGGEPVAWLLTQRRGGAPSSP